MTEAQKRKYLLDQPVIEPLREEYNKVTGLDYKSTGNGSSSTKVQQTTSTKPKAVSASSEQLVPYSLPVQMPVKQTSQTWNGNISLPQVNTEKPQYASPYGAQIDAMLSQLEAGGSFEYDYKKDPDYEAYRQIYTDAGRRAMEDTVGTMAASTGGIASSYAGSAGQQAYNGYMAQLAGVIPELSANAYSRWANERQDKYSRLSTLMNLENTEYNKYLTELSQYNADREYEYNQYLNERNYLYQLERDAIEDQRYDEALEYERMINERDFEYQKMLNDRNYQYQIGRDEIEDQRYANALEYDRDAAEREFEYQKYLNDRNYQYQLDRDNIEDQRYNEALDYERQQNDIAFNQWRTEFEAAQTQEERNRLFEEAVLAAEYGDFSRLKALGIDTSEYETTAETDDYDPLSTDVIDTILAQAQKYADLAGTARSHAVKITDLGNEIEIPSENLFNQGGSVPYFLKQMFNQGQITYSQYLAALEMASSVKSAQSAITESDY